MPTREVKTQFYLFRQNNSGGSFVIRDEDGIGVVVCIEALNADDANRRAEAIGIYFNGCDDGRDCNCCGDRWSPVWKDEGTDTLDLNETYDYTWHDTAYIHHMDGTIERIKNNSR
jgi:hypothetical protein